MRNQAGEAVSVDVGDLIELPVAAAVEVAAYRITTEALTNAARHSLSRTACVRIGVREEELWLEVADDGGASGDWHPGVGLSSMRQRASELGRRLEAGQTTTGGRVEAVLPLG